MVKNIFLQSFLSLLFLSFPLASFAKGTEIHNEPVFDSKTQFVPMPRCETTGSFAAWVLCLKNSLRDIRSATAKKQGLRPQTLQMRYSLIEGAQRAEERAEKAPLWNYLRNAQFLERPTVDNSLTDFLKLLNLPSPKNLRLDRFHDTNTVKYESYLKSEIRRREMQSLDEEFETWILVLSAFSADISLWVESSLCAFGPPVWTQNEPVLERLREHFLQGLRSLALTAPIQALQIYRAVILASNPGLAKTVLETQPTPDLGASMTLVQHVNSLESWNAESIERFFLQGELPGKAPSVLDSNVTQLIAKLRLLKDEDPVGLGQQPTPESNSHAVPDLIARLKASPRTVFQELTASPRESAHSFALLSDEDLLRYARDNIVAGNPDTVLEILKNSEVKKAFGALRLKNLIHQLKSLICATDLRPSP